jgi:hypothetical protein
MLSWRCASSSRWNMPTPRAGHAGDTTGEVYMLSLNNLTALPVNSLYIMGEAYTQLELNIISAQDLKKIHLFGMMQTYGVVWINFEKKLTTQIDKTGGANPTWNDKAIFRVEERFLRSETSALMMEIYCVGCLRDTLVGTVRVFLSNLLKGYGSKDFRSIVLLVVHMAFSTLAPCFLTDSIFTE